MEGNWSFAVQVSWLIYSKDIIKIKEQNCYVSNKDFKISETALPISGLSTDFLQQNGIPRKELLNVLPKGLEGYQLMNG